MEVRRIKNDELYHYGIKGMKWRHHKKQDERGYNHLSPQGTYTNGYGAEVKDYKDNTNNVYVSRWTHPLDGTDREEVKNLTTGRIDHYITRNSGKVEKYTDPKSLKSWAIKGNDPRYQKSVSRGRKFINKLFKR